VLEIGAGELDNDVVGGVFLSDGISEGSNVAVDSIFWLLASDSDKSSESLEEGRFSHSYWRQS